jgi:hypothetical protein
MKIKNSFQAPGKSKIEDCLFKNYKISKKLKLSSTLKRVS